MASLPKVRDGFLLQQIAEEISVGPITIGTAEWYTWLEHHRSFCFEAQGCSFTARKERRPGGWYWYGYRRMQGKLHRAYIGKTARLTLERLNEVAKILEKAGDALQGSMYLIGTAGIGKTRLAIQVATDLLEDFDDGAYFVPLAPISDKDLVPSTIARSFGLKESSNRSMVEHLKVYLSNKCLLLVLDNFEHVVTAAPLLVELLTACPKLKLLVTSREVLHLHVEEQFSVPPLALPDLKHLEDIESPAQFAAVELFNLRAQAVLPGFRMTAANANTIATICTRLDGLPLAIELAAARIKLLSPQALLARLEHRLYVLTQGPQDVPERQQALRNTIQWSYDLLDAQEQRLFRQLSVFAGGCTLEAVEAVCQASGNETMNVLEGVASLIDKSLLYTTRQEDEEPRLGMLETIREYGLECLETCGEMEVIRYAHASYYLRLVEAAEPQLVGAEQGQWSDRLEQELENIRATMRWFLEREDVGEGIEIPFFLNALSAFWTERGYLSEARQWFERLLTTSAGAVTLRRAVELWCASRLAFNQDDFHQAERLAQEGLELFRKLDDKRGVGLALLRLGDVASRRHNHQKACLLLEESVTILRKWGFKTNLAYSLSSFAPVLSEQGKYTRACVLAEESLALFRELNHLGGVAHALCCLAKAHLLQGEYHSARIVGEEGLAIARKLGMKSIIASSLQLLGQVALHQGDGATARTLLMESLAIKRESGSRWTYAELLILLGSIVAFQRDDTQANSLFKESLAILKDLNDAEMVASVLENVAEAVLAQGSPTWSARLWGAAHSMREAIGALLPLDNGP